MAVTHTIAISREQCFQQIDKLIKSHSLRTSESLCRLLRYLAEHSLDHPGVALKEYQIATEVLGRSAGFDPQSDSTARVQAGRLRVKLAEYYAHEGTEDLIVVEIPKGSYALTFHVRPSKAGAQPAISLIADAAEKRKEPARSIRGWAITVLILSVLLAATISTIVSLLWQRVRTPVATSQAVPVVYQIFWSPFVTGPQQPWVIFSNGSFVGRPETGMRYFNPATDSKSFILDHYTGVGEVLAIHQLDHVFALLNHPLRVKRGSLFSLDDAQNNDLIFVGSPSENLTLLDIPGSKEFTFQRLTSGPRKGDLSIVNVHPQPGEPVSVLASPSTSPLTEDYAIVALMPGLNPARSVMILAGTTTFGTQGAVEFVCRQDSVGTLLSRLGATKPDELKPFEALLRVKITRGVPVETELVAVRK